MSTLNITTSYSDGAILYEADLDHFKTDLETFFNTTLITGTNLQTNSLTGADKIAQANITTAKILDNAITSAKIEDGTATTGVSTANLNTNAITTAKIVDSAITNAKIAGSITHDKIASNAIDDEQLLPSYNIAEGTFVSFTSSALVAQNTGITCTVPLSGLNRPVLIQMQGSTSSSSPGQISRSSSSGDYISIYKDSTELVRYFFHGVGGGGFFNIIPSSTIAFIDINASGSSATYTIYITSIASTGAIISGTLCCMEL